MSPDNWPSPPLSAMLFESPWVLCLALLIFAGAMFFFSGKRRLQQLAFVPVLAAVGVVVLSFVVETDRERMVANTEALVYAVAKPGDIDTFARLLHDDVRFIDRDKEQLVAAARKVLSSYGPDSHSILAIKVHQDDPDTGHVYVALLSHLTGAGGQGYQKTTWMMTWKRVGDAWRLREVEWLTLNNEPANKRLIY
ncbi:MAG: DUF4440 domain-containing protein [Phycisphaera sp.]|nr:DUF4440 domain-containing protein [Phycisphaera sp.]